MYVVFLGAPGVGKGTMAVRLSDERGLPHIAPGDIFRSNIRDKTPLGQQVSSILAQGALVPDELTIELVQDRINQPDVELGAIFDGFPRTIVQADALAMMVPIACAVQFDLSDADIIERLSGRRVHSASGRTYHIKYNPPQVEGKDDKTGEPLIQRPDDSEEAIRQRLKVYNEQTLPLIQYYQERKLLKNVDASPAPDVVYGSLVKLLDTL